MSVRIVRFRGREIGCFAWDSGLVNFSSAVAKSQYVAMTQETLPQEIVDYVAPKYREQFVAWATDVTWANSAPFPIPPDMMEKFGHVRPIDAIIDIASPWYDSQQVKQMLAGKVEAVKTALDETRKLDRESRLEQFYKTAAYKDKAAEISKWRGILDAAKSKLDQEIADLEELAHELVDDTAQVWGEAKIRFADMSKGSSNLWEYQELYPTKFKMRHADLGTIKGIVDKTADGSVICTMMAKGQKYTGIGAADTDSPPYAAVRDAFLTAYKEHSIKKTFSYNVKHAILKWPRWRVDEDGKPIDNPQAAKATA